MGGDIQVKNVMKYIPFIVTFSCIVFLGFEVLKKYAEDNLPVFNVDDWL